MKKHVVTGPIWRLLQCHPTISNSYSYSCQMFLHTFWNTRIVSHNNNKHTNSEPEKFPGDFAISSRFPGFPGVLDTLLSVKYIWCNVQSTSTDNEP